MNDLFWKRNVTEDFRKNSTFEERKVKYVYYGEETISFIGSKIWELVPSNINDSENVNIFKSNIKSWKPENRTCALYRLYIANIWLIELQLVLLIDYNLFWYMDFVLVEVDFCHSVCVYGYFCVYRIM